MGRRVELGFHEGNLNLQDIQAALKDIWKGAMWLLNTPDIWHRRADQGRKFGGIF